MFHYFMQNDVKKKNESPIQSNKGTKSIINNFEFEAGTCLCLFHVRFLRLLLA